MIRKSRNGTRCCRRGNIAHGNDIFNDMQTAGHGDRFQTFKSKSTVDRIISGRTVSIFRYVFPDKDARNFRSVGHCSPGGRPQFRNGASLDRIVTHQRIGDETFRRGFFRNFLRGYGGIPADQAGRGRVDGEAARVFRGAHDHKSFTGVGIDTCRFRAGQHGRLLVFGGGSLIAVVNTDDFTIPGKRELNRVGCGGIRIPRRVHNIHGNIGKTGSVGSDFGSVGVHIQTADNSGS